MANWYVKSVAGQISDTGKQVGQKVAEEPIEILKSTQSQVLTPQASTSDKPLVQEIISTSGSKQLTDEEKKKIEKQERQRMQEVEAELAKARQQRKDEQKVWSEEQKRLLTPEETHKPKVSEEPTTKRKSHMLGQIEKKQGTREMGKQISG